MHVGMCCTYVREADDFIDSTCNVYMHVCIYVCTCVYYQQHYHSIILLMKGVCMYDCMYFCMTGCDSMDKTCNLYMYARMHAYVCVFVHVCITSGTIILLIEL
jgi:hypothetical protein